ncbi:STAS domain-containing protein [Streptomyces ficellus]|uniref:Anti-sigma factor antagonist n=1 Tax=Streptomyces ficellus TaxID=1977088 RepID=A0A6I6FE84_9ACTN|nr:anti-sigma factor antagonist [Streptomyces ficellus]QGV81990.1 anti-sigma factor antagonist [Streptomyces ficellus]
MLFPCHRPSVDQLLIEIHDVIDLPDEEPAERALASLIAGSGVRTVLVDLRTPLVTGGMVAMLLRLRAAAHARGATLAVVARRPLARKVFRICGAHRTLRVSATLSGARAVTRGCHHDPALPAQRERGAGEVRFHGTRR